MSVHSSVYGMYWTPAEDPFHNMQNLRDLLLVVYFRSQIQQHTRGRDEPMPRWVKAILAAKGELTQY